MCVVLFIRMEEIEKVLFDKFPTSDVEIIRSGDFEIEKLIEYITDDIVVVKPKILMVYRHLIRFVVKPHSRGKIYYLADFNDDDLKLIHAGLLKYTWKSDTKIQLFKNANPEKDVLGID